MSDPLGTVVGMNQLAFPCRGCGGYRPGSGRKRGNRVSHHGRQPLRRRLPVHVIWRVRADVRSLRGKKLFGQIREAFRRCCEKVGFRLVHFSVLGTHVHMIVEADDTAALSRGMQGLGVSIAKRINFVSPRRGSAFKDRYFARQLRTPREAANAVEYVLRNEAHHLRRMGRPVDPRAGEGFTSLEPWVARLTAPPRTWLLLTVALE